MADTVLIADGSGMRQEILSRALRCAGLNVCAVSGGGQALTLLRSQPVDLILAARELPDMDGFHLVETLRSSGIKTPVILVGGQDPDWDALYALDIGADDYVTRPFHPVILAAKVKALIRRSRGGFSHEDGVISAGPFRYDTSTLRFYKNGEEIVLSSRENAMMKLFLDNINRVFSRNTLYERIWGEAIVDENTVMVYINRLRRKIEDDPAHPRHIQTVRGLGYRFVV